MHIPMSSPAMHPGHMAPAQGAGQNRGARGTSVAASGGEEAGEAPGARDEAGEAQESGGARPQGSAHAREGGRLDIMA